MKKQYPYSNDIEFLGKIDNLRIKEQWVKIILLEYNSEIPLESIEGKVASGTLTKAGDSAVRRTCNLSCVVDAFKYNPEDIKANYSISKKIYLELGITNSTNDYTDEDIIWFPQGVFFITNFSISASATGAATINLQFKDKMAQLDGTIGGILPATTRFDITTTMINGNIYTNKTLVYDIIMETVNHFGGEDISNIIIDDVPVKAKRIIRWMGAESLWIYPILGNGKISYDVCLTSDLDEKQSAHTPINYNGQIIGAKEYKTNQNIGYVYENFVYDEELTFNAGSKVTDVLDKIKNWLGNYEYFYDEQGQFHFQEIKNYLNNSQSAEIWDKIVNTNDIDYLYESTKGKSIYTFDDNINLISITNTPVYENIKNDFIVEGEISINDIKRTCRYHLVIDDKPTITSEGYNNVLIYTDPLTKNVTITKPKIVTPKRNKNGEYVWLLPEFAENGDIYGLLDEPKTFTFKKPLQDMADFEIYYNNLVNKENTLISRDSLSNINIKDYLFTFLEKYMGYSDNTLYKTKYRSIIFTLARQLSRYSSSNTARQSSLPTTLEYYETLYNQYISDIDNYGITIANKISWCGELLQLLYNLFTDIPRQDKPDDNYKDSEYWAPINSTIPMLWEGIQYSQYAGALKNFQKSQCINYIEILQIKQKQLNVLIEQYTQIINNYNTQIASFKRNGVSTTSITTEKEKVQSQVNNYLDQQEICNERLLMLYAVLTALGASGIMAGETYYPIDVTFSTRESSFWYYNTDKNKGSYGWNKLIWYKYYCDREGTTSYYPDGLGPMTYIDYSKIDWGYDINFTNTYYPSMNKYSNWYQNYYIDYAIANELPYIDIEEPNTYIPINWRTELLLMGLRAEENGTDPGHYYQELKLNWPAIYDFKNEQLLNSSINYIDYFVGNTGVLLGNEYSFVNGTDNKAEAQQTNKAKFKENQEAEIKNFLLNYENDHYYYFFDMIDSSSPTWGEYSVNNIGRRTNVNINSGVNCIFAPKIPDYAFINVSGLTTQERREAFSELENVAEDIIQVTSLFYDNFATGSFKQSAYEQIRYDLQKYTSYQNTISITAIPCFYLEPNVRVELKDSSTNTFGEYVIKSISIPLGIGNNMSVSMTKAMERI